MKIRLTHMVDDHQRRTIGYFMGKRGACTRTDFVRLVERAVSIEIDRAVQAYEATGATNGDVPGQKRLFETESAAVGA